MAAYLSAAKKAAILARMRSPLKASVQILLDETALAVAQGVTDAGTNGGTAITAAIDNDPAGAIYTAAQSWIGDAIDAAIVENGAIEDAINATPESDLSLALTAHFEGIRADYAASNVADLDQDVSAAYVEAEVQAISDKVDAILSALKSAGVMTPDA